MTHFEPVAKRMPGLRPVLAVALLLNFALVAVAQETELKRVHFARGHSSVILRNAVVRGAQDRYLLGAKTGQTMTVRITSAEHNAVFSITRPGGEFLPHATDESESTKWSGKLPADGDYTIQVGGTRGNATYALTIAIK